MNAHLEKLGFNPWLLAQIDRSMTDHHQIARVMAVHKDNYQIAKSKEDVYAELSGNLLYTSNTPLDLPTTGDWVYADFYDDDTHAIIHGVLPRKTLLKRKTAGKQVDYQLIAANVDVAFIIQSVDDNLNLRRLERYLVMVNESAIQPVILLSKCDLISQETLDQIIQQIMTIAPATEVLAFSNLSETNIDSIRSVLIPGYTYCLLGSSGVGKTTLLNKILGNDHFATQPVSEKYSKGRHTTTRRELIQLDNGSLFIDTPGMRELGNLSVNSGLNETFTDIFELAEQCQFGNCSHTKEKGCAILEAVNQGKLSVERFNNYQKMQKESAFNALSYYEKRHKDKAFGKLVKTTLKNKKRFKQ